MEIHRLTQLYLIRHAQSQDNALCDCDLDKLPKTKLGSDLSPLEIKQAEHLARDLQLIKFDSIYTSHLQRTHQTAQIIFSDRNTNIILNGNLKERDKQTESDKEATLRFTNEVNNIVNSNLNQTIAIITHSFVIRAFLNAIGHQKIDNMPPGYIQNTGYLKFEFEDNFYRLIDTQRVG